MGLLIFRLRKKLVTQETGDFGIDILAEKDSVKYAIQCKCYSSAIGNKAVQEAYSGKSYYNCMVAVVLTNNYFTNAARETATRNSVVLWDRNDLDAMIKRAGEHFDWKSFVQQGKARYAHEEHKRQERAHKAREDRERQERAYWERERQERASKERGRNDFNESSSPDFFKGCTTWEQVRERYRKLMQIYHPDNESGDEGYSKEINAQYDRLREKHNRN